MLPASSLPVPLGPWETAVNSSLQSAGTTPYPAPAANAVAAALVLEPDVAHQRPGKPHDEARAPRADGESLRRRALACFEAGAVAEAIALMQEALTLGPASTEGWNELGNLLAHAGRLTEAAQAFRRALGRSPRAPAIWNNLGAVLLRDGHLVGAECAFRRAITLQVTFHEAHLNLAQLLDQQGDALEAARHHCLAFVHGPREGKAPAMLGIAYYHLGEYEAAAQIYREWLEAEPGNPIARHRLAACLSTDVPDRAANDYLEQSFDAYAERFDEHLQGLGYRGPEVVTEALARERLPTADARVLDAGCGTGICGPRLRSWASLLAGVDLSGGMLARAGERQCYDQLEQAELSAWLGDQSALWDIVVASDSFNYTGNLAQLLRNAGGAVSDHGLLVFTVEDGRGLCGDRGWHLAAHGRYLHDARQVEQWLDAAAFDVRSVRPVVLRREMGREVKALVYVARRRMR